MAKMRHLLSNLLPLLSVVTLLVPTLALPTATTAATTSTLDRPHQQRFDHAIKTLLPRQPKDCTAEGANCTCSDWSFSSPGVGISGFYYWSASQMMVPGREDSWIAHGDVEFVVANPALPYKAVCSGSSSTPTEFFYGETWYTCDQEGDGKDDQGPGLTWFRYDKRRDVVDVKQSWVCTGKAQHLSFQAKGNVTASLHCQTMEWLNDNWKEGEVYRLDTAECPAENRTLNVPWYEIIAG